MTTITNTPYAASAAQAEERELTVDSLNVREAVIGDGLMLSQHGNRIQLHTVGQGRAELIGTYENAAAALAALDAIDLAA